MPKAVYICAIGCMVECRHHQACVVGTFGGIDPEHPHPLKRGREAHFAYDFDTGLMHEWVGVAGKCNIYDPGDPEDDDPGEEVETLEAEE